MNTSRKGEFDFSVSRWPKLPRLPGVFVTGTDTGVGKTAIAGAIARRLRVGGRRVEVFKPAATGCRPSRGQLVSADADFLAACADSRRLLADIVPVRYAHPLAPNVAAELEKRPVDLELIFESWRRLAAEAECAVVEGIGGLLCPISDDFWVIHMARMLAMPVVIVARPLLGTINHTLLTLHAARSAGLEVAGVVVNRFRRDTSGEPDIDMAMQTNPDQIARRGRVKVLALVGEDAETSVEKCTMGRATRFAIDNVDWESVVFGGRGGLRS
jgi:dethiobiotin synthetase